MWVCVCGGGAIDVNRGSLELILIKSRVVHQLAMRLHAAPRALLRGTAVLNDRSLPLLTLLLLCL
jgi:hypothetical protein